VRFSIDFGVHYSYASLINRSMVMIPELTSWARGHVYKNQSLLAMLKAGPVTMAANRFEGLEDRS